MRKSLAILLIIFSAFNLKAQTYDAPNLICAQNIQNGDVRLIWELPIVACGPFISYKIYRANAPGGPYTLIHTETNAGVTQYVDNPPGGNIPPKYYYMESEFNCPGQSSAQSDTIPNGAPTTPQIVAITVQNGLPVIIWNVSPDPQTYAYVVQEYVNNIFSNPLDTVVGRFDTTYTHINSNYDPTQEPLTYNIKAIDKCGGSGGTGDFSQEHRTIYIELTDVDTCAREAQLTWTKYIGWPQNVDRYELLVSKNSGPEVVTQTFDSTAVTAFLSGVDPEDTLCIRIRARKFGDTSIVSYSNQICVNPIVVNTPDYFQLINATVGPEPDEHVFLTWRIDDQAEIVLVSVDRSDDQVNWNDLERYNVTPPIPATGTYEDMIVNSDDVAKFYRITDFDKCGNRHYSSIVRPVCLKTTLVNFYEIELNWNQFFIDSGQVINYTLYRDAGNGSTFLGTFPPGTGFYRDDLTDFVEFQGEFCYRIRTRYQLRLYDGSDTTMESWSNVACEAHRPLIYIPNAFVPNGVNREFKPVIVYGTNTDYEMHIYNRWGEKVFTSNDVNVGWDGYVNGNLAPMGGYAYVITFTAQDGNRISRQGMVTLVR
jgi:gliding motility-associated-like protein